MSNFTYSAILLTGLLLSTQAVAATTDYTHSTVQNQIDDFPEGLAHAVFSKNEIWVATDFGELWQIQTSGTTRRLPLELPTRAGIDELIATSAGVDLLAAGDVYQALAPDSVLHRARLEADVWSAVRVRGGYVGLSSVRNQLVYFGEHETRALEFIETIEEPEDVENAQEQEEQTNSPNEELAETAPKAAKQKGTDRTHRPSDPTVVPGEGRLIKIDDERVAYVLNSPYEIWLLDLNGTSRRIAIDESELAQSLAAEPDHDEGGALWRTRTTAGWFGSGELVVDRQVREIHASHEGRRAKIHTYLDVIELESGELRERFDLAKVKGSGMPVGLRGRDFVFLAIRPGGQSAVSILTRR